MIVYLTEFPCFVAWGVEMIIIRAGRDKVGPL